MLNSISRIKDLPIESKWLQVPKPDAESFEFLYYHGPFLFGRCGRGGWVIGTRDIEFKIIIFNP